jgi:CheY-like chemotaxis protein
MRVQVSNACKFAGSTPVSVRAWLEAPEAHAPQEAPRADEPPLHWLSLRVSDGGHGMNADEAAACFKMHTHADAARGGGHGLGLFISREFAKLMGGTLSCVSRPGGGSSFSLCVPVRVLSDEEAASVATDAAAVQVLADAAEWPSADDAAALARAEQDPPSPRSQRAVSPGSQLRCLFADDHLLNLKLVTRLLESSGFHVTPVQDGGAALAALKAAASPGGTPFDVAVLDMVMPVLTGPQACVAYREWEREHGLPRTPIVALTANALEEHASECERAGCDAFLSKPMRAEALAVLRAHAAQAAERRAVAAVRREGAPADG